MVTILRLASIVALTSTTALAVAQIMPPVEMGDSMRTWPLQVIMAFITLCSMAIMVFLMRHVFATIVKHTEQNARLTEVLTELCARLNVRPCLLDKK